jgi:hypothetical protein
LYSWTILFGCFAKNYLKKNNHYPTLFFPRTNFIFFHRLVAANYDSVLSFFSACKVSETIFNESSKSTENALIEWLQKDTTKYFLYVVSLVTKCSLKNWFWNLSSTSGLSQIWKIRNAWKFPNACLKDNSDP